MSSINPNEQKQNGWNEWSRLVVFRFDQLESNYKELLIKMEVLKSELMELKNDLKNDYNKHSQEINTLKTKATVWGSVAAFVVATVTSIIVKIFF